VKIRAIRVLIFHGKFLNSKLKTNPPSPGSGAAQAKLVTSLLDWFGANARDLPWRRTRDPYAIWVSEIMLQQTQVKTVIPFWERWMRELPTIEAAAGASPDKLHKLWEGLGYYTRVRNLQKAAQEIVQSGKWKAESGNKSEIPHVVSYKFPEKFEKVLALPGIGRYTAGAICSIAFNQPTPILDGNVIRVLTRLFGIAENPKEKETNARLWQLAEQLVSHAKTRGRRGKNSPLSASAPWREDNSCSHLNQSLMELGALICTPRNAQCQVCPVKKLCVAYAENRVDELPNLGKRETATSRHFIAFAIECKGKFLVQQRSAGVVNAYLWEFPNFEVANVPSSHPSSPTGEKVAEGRLGGNEPVSFENARAAFQKLFSAKPKAIQPLRTMKHSITRYRITLEAFSVSLDKRPAKPIGRWLTPGEFDSIAFSSAHKKLASAAAKSILSSR
jgi:A/G-specific adenine glycosylase